MEKICSREALDALPEASAELRQQYLQVIGVLMYLCNTTRMESCVTVNKLSRASANPSAKHYDMACGVLAFMYHTADKQVTFDGKCGWMPDAYCDSDWATWGSTSGWCIMMCGTANTLG